MPILIFKKVGESKESIHYAEATEPGNPQTIGTLHVFKKWAGEEEILRVKVEKFSDIAGAGRTNG